jgi:ABC-type sugar transport system permease subunit
LSSLRERLFTWQQRHAPYVFIAPFIVLFLTFGLYPLVKSLILSFYITAGPTNQVFVGLDNFRFLLTDPDFYTAVANTSVFALASVTIQLPLSLALALMLNHRFLKGRSAFRLAFFSPRLVGMVFVGVLFSLIFATRFGLLNVVLHDATAGLFGEDAAFPLSTAWLGDKSLVMPALVLTSLWLYVGFNMIYFLAALQNVDQALYEAAMVDGAGPVARFRHVTLPGIKPVAVFVVVLSTIGSFQLFELPYLMLNNSAGPGKAGLTVVMYLYQNGFVSGDLGYASTIGWTLAAGVLLLALVQMRLSGTMRKGGQ